MALMCVRAQQSHDLGQRGHRSMHQLVVTVGILQVAIVVDVVVVPVVR